MSNRKYMFLFLAVILLAAGLGVQGGMRDFVGIADDADGDGMRNTFENQSGVTSSIDPDSEQPVVLVEGVTVQTLPLGNPQRRRDRRATSARAATPTRSRLAMIFNPWRT